MNGCSNLSSLQVLRESMLYKSNQNSSEVIPTLQFISLQNIYAPSATLHLSNIPADAEEDAIKDAFEEAGFSVEAFKFFA